MELPAGCPLFGEGNGQGENLEGVNQEGKTDELCGDIGYCLGVNRYHLR